MRTAVITGAVAALAVAIAGWGTALGNADFVYMCAGARLVGDGILPVTPYFPPGYPLLLWPLIQAGLSALTAGMLLAALGSALSAGAVAYVARLYQVPAAVAFALGLLGASLPDVFQIAFNPHLDALFTGLTAVFIALAFRLLARDSGWGGAWSLALLGALLLTLRWHAALVVIPVLLALLCCRRAACRRASLLALALAIATGGWVYWSLYITTGNVETAAMTQVATGAAYHEYGDRATEVLYEDYAAWLAAAPAVGTAEVIAGVKANWPQFLSRKALWLAAAAWLIALIGFGRLAPGSILMLLFIAGYTLAVSPAYFTPRASALPEVVALMLLGSSLGLMLKRPDAARPQQKQIGIDPALAGAVVFVLLLAGIGYNAWREAAVLRQWQSERLQLVAAMAQAHSLVGGNHEQILGALDTTCIDDGAYCLPSASYSRLWLDDPRVAPLIDELLPRCDVQDIIDGTAPVAVILLWEEPPGHRGRNGDLKLIAELERSWVWREQIADVDGARLWTRKR